MTHCQELHQQFDELSDQLETLMDVHLCDWPRLQQAWTDFRTELRWALDMDLPTEIERREK